MCFVFREVEISTPFKYLYNQRPNFEIMIKCLDIPSLVEMKTIDKPCRFYYPNAEHYVT